MLGGYVVICWCVTAGGSQIMKAVLHTVGANCNVCCLLSHMLRATGPLGDISHSCAQTPRKEGKKEREADTV